MITKLTIGILAGTTTGIEPIYAVAYKRRYLKDNKWNAQFCIDATAKSIIQETGVDPEKIETARSLANDVERRIKFQADVQDYVDMAISSTCNMPAWGTEYNNEDRVELLLKHCLSTLQDCEDLQYIQMHLEVVSLSQKWTIVT